MTIARILFTIALPEPFDYEIPEGMPVVPGSYVLAPLGKNLRTGVVWDVIDRAADDERELKAVERLYEVPPMTASMRKFIDWSAAYCVASPGAVLAMALRSRGGLEPSPRETVYHLGDETPARITAARSKALAAAEELCPASASEIAKAAGVSSGVVVSLANGGALRSERRAIDAPFERPDPTRKGLNLTPDQSAASARIVEKMGSGGFQTFLLDGVTGSGKTEVYFEAISHALKTDPDAQVLILLPEIALTQAVLGRFADRFGAPPAAWHSGLSDKERRRAWREVAHGRARIIMGARSALFLPYQNLKLLIVDEEHDGSYKQEDGVIYHARDLAVVRAKSEDAALILASATPALETAVNGEQGRYDVIRLKARPGAARLPDIELVNLREYPPQRGQWLSPVVWKAMEDTLDRGEQTLLFLNRRGYAPLVICMSCGERLKSPGTDNWLTEHRYSRQLVCHVTGFTMPKPDRCPKCGATDSLKGIGPGVERLAEEVRTRLPEARVEIFSSDTAQTGEDTRDIVTRMAAGEIDVLIGTQIVAKGHNFPKLTLVGVVDADSGMKGGDLRAGERTYQLLSQVAGRAGRADKPGRALIQTYAPDEIAMQALAAGDRDGFLAAERDMRALLGLPPFGRLAALILSAPSEVQVDEMAREIAKVAPNGDGVEVFGPAPAPLSVIRGRHRRRFLIQAPKTINLSAYMASWRKAMKIPSAGRVAVDIDPYSFL